MRCSGVENRAHDRDRTMENAPPSGRPALPVFSNADIADRLAALAQLLSANKENPYKVKPISAPLRKSGPFRKASTTWSLKRRISLSSPARLDTRAQP